MHGGRGRVSLWQQEQGRRRRQQQAEDGRVHQDVLGEGVCGHGSFPRGARGEQGDSDNSQGLQGTYVCVCGYVGMYIHHVM